MAGGSAGCSGYLRPLTDACNAADEAPGVHQVVHTLVMLQLNGTCKPHITCPFD
jgi:hypothetical protein